VEEERRKEFFGVMLKNTFEENRKNITT